VLGEKLMDYYTKNISQNMTTSAYEKLGSNIPSAILSCSTMYVLSLSYTEKKSFSNSSTGHFFM
jgi:hypothetical protein